MDSAEYIYEAFGEIAHRTGSTPNDFMFTGEQWEPGLGMYYLRARYYEPATGRLNKRDPWQGNAESPLTRNSYLYCSSNPIDNIDPSGMFMLAEFTVANSIRSVLAQSQLSMFFDFQAIASDPENAEKNIYIGLAFQIIIPIGLAGISKIASVAEKVVKRGGWLQLHEGIRVGKSISHTITKHVNVDDAYLASRLASENLDVASRFFNQDIAEEAISRCISWEENRNKVKAFLRNPKQHQLSLRYRGMNKSIGVGMIKGCGNETAELNNVLVILRKNGKKYYIFNAYPEF